MIWWDTPKLTESVQPKRLVVLGATGSIGRSVRDIVQRYPQEFELIGLACRRNVREVLKWLDVKEPKRIVFWDDSAREDFLRRTGWDEKRVFSGFEAIRELCQLSEATHVVNALVGALGLYPTFDALRAGKRVCIANKESIVTGGPVLRELARQCEGALIPVDSEHSAVFQSILGEQRDYVARIWLTASGGPFLHRSLETFRDITPDEALQHPNWSMGPKITIDSATLMNKGLEIIEAHYLFDWPEDKIEVVIHPQSIIHSFVEFIDGSFKAQLSHPDMHLPILYALSYPERWASSFHEWVPWKSAHLEFFEPDTKRFPCLELAREALRMGKSYPVVLNASNEVAVEAFLGGRIHFPDIPRIIEESLQTHKGVELTSLETILHIDREARKVAESIVKKLGNKEC